MLAPIKEMASYRDEVTNKCHLVAANYLEACNKLFETGISSHGVVDSSISPVLSDIVLSCYLHETNKDSLRTT